MSLQSISPNIAANVHSVRRRIAAAARSHQRDPDEVVLVAVSKQQPAAAVRAAAAAGCADFGENYLQEALDKIAALADLALTWHFIGPVQSNKTRHIAEHFDWVHTLSRTKIAERLSAQCPRGRTLNVTVQVNVDQDPDKSGVGADAAAELVRAIAGLPNLRLRGLMTILRHPGDHADAALDGYRRLAALFDELACIAPPPWDTLSMGMSGDFPQAIAAGATHVRVGSALFGPRPAR